MSELLGHGIDFSDEPKQPDLSQPKTGWAGLLSWGNYVDHIGVWAESPYPQKHAAVQNVDQGTVEQHEPVLTTILEVVNVIDLPRSEAPEIHDIGGMAVFGVSIDSSSEHRRAS